MPQGSKRKAPENEVSQATFPASQPSRNRNASADSETGELMNWIDALNPETLAEGSFDPIPVNSSATPANPMTMGGMGQTQATPAAPYGLPSQQLSPNDFQQQQQQQINQIQQMLMLQQQTLQKITEALPAAGSGASRGASPVPGAEAHEPILVSSATKGSTPMLPPAVRRAKKPQNGEYEQKLKVLKEENERLKRHLTSVNNKSVRVTEEKKKSMEDMERIVKMFKSGEKLDELGNGKGKDALMTVDGLQSFIKEYTNMYSDYGNRRLDELTFHLGQLERLVMPTTSTKMGLWTLEQDDKFFENTARGSLAGILARELQISEAQKKKVVGHRGEIKKINSNLRRTLELLIELKDTVAKKHRLFSDRMEKCTRILEPVQVIKLLLWVHKNEGELREVCPGWGSEQIIEQETEAQDEEKPASPKIEE